MGGLDFTHAPSKAPLAPPAAPDVDPLGMAALAARQRAAQRMRDGMDSSFGTSTRGLEGAPGSGVKGPPNPGDDLPIITTMTGREAELAGLKTVDQLRAEARAVQPGDTSGPTQPLDSGPIIKAPLDERLDRFPWRSRGASGPIIPWPRVLGAARAA